MNGPAFGGVGCGSKSASDEGAADTPEIVPRSKAIASSSLPSVVRRVASAMAVCESGFMKQIPLFEMDMAQLSPSREAGRRFASEIGGSVRAIGKRGLDGRTRMQRAKDLDGADSFPRQLR